MEKVSQTDVTLQEHFRDSLLIDRFDPQLEFWRKHKLEKSQSESNEDAIVWNVFRTFNQIDRKLWVEQLFFKAFHQELAHPTEHIEMKLWKTIHPPKSLPIKEAKSEIDIVIESDTFVWFIEAKYKSDISLASDPHSNRDQVLRNIDIGTNYARKRDFYYSLLILDKYNSPIGFRMVNEYKDSIGKIVDLLLHRQELTNLKNISVFQWKEIQSLFKTVYLYSKNKYERYIADQVSYWLYDKIQDDM
ncbi:MAG TPA: hypothetical protein VNS08_00340 [Ureibacillus sp.]|nr:hypothetical protein [Ureibacillus sp.]